MVSEKFSFKTRNFTENVWLINFFATHQFRSFRWLIFPSILLACNKLKIGQDAWANQLFQLLNLVRIYGHGFFELTRTLMTKNVNNDFSKDSAIQFALCLRQKLNYLLEEDISESIPREFRFWPWLNLYITFYWTLIKTQKFFLNLICAQMFVFSR